MDRVELSDVRSETDPVRRAAAAASLGHHHGRADGRDDAHDDGQDDSNDDEASLEALEWLAIHDDAAVVRRSALGALARVAGQGKIDALITAAIGDPDPSVRRRACELAASIGSGDVETLVGALDDDEVLVAEAAAHALGEHVGLPSIAVEQLARVTSGHPDPLVREAAVAALGAIGNEAGKAAVLAACGDKPAIRRRAVLALAAFEGEDVEIAIDAARGDRDWQVRDAAALLDREPP